MKLLHIDSSVLGTHSASRALSAEIVAKQVELHPDIQVAYRDLAADAALHLSSAHLAAWQGGAVEDSVLGADLAKGGGYLEELFAADIIVIGAPMYNFSVPSQLKAWIDRVVVAGKTGVKTVQQCKLFLRWQRHVIGDVISRADEVVEGKNCRTITRRDEPRRHREIFIPVSFARPQCARITHGNSETLASDTLACARPFHMPPRPRAC